MTTLNFLSEVLLLGGKEETLCLLTAEVRLTEDSVCTTLAAVD